MVGRKRASWSRRGLGNEVDRATFRTLHTASLAGRSLREGLSRASAERSLSYLRALLGAPAVALTDGQVLLGYDELSPEPAHGHAGQAEEYGLRAVAGAATVASKAEQPLCIVPGCRCRHAIACPLVIEGRVVGALICLTDQPSAGLLRAAEEVAAWVSGQLELAELDASRHRLAQAEVRALRAQISPHFIYNSLNAIASFVRTDPVRARELLIEFADFTRYSFGKHGEFTTLAEELRSIERYLLLEQARFGERLAVTLRIAPEVLGVRIPFLCLQPLIENAVRHGLESAEAGGRITIEARDADRDCVITVEDDGVGEDPERIRAILAGDPTSDSVGLANVDERLRNTFGDDYGLTVDTAPGAGTLVTVRIPKFAPGAMA